MGTVSRRTTTVLAVGLVAGVLAAVPHVGQAAEPVTCAAAEHEGGDWPRYGHDLSNTRSQPAESTIGTAEVSGLEMAWAHTSENGVYNNTPIVADGCLYLASSDGTVSAHNANTGELIWATALDTSPPGFGGGLVATPALTDSLVLVIVNQEGSPYLQALDRATGAPGWQVVLDRQNLAMSNSSPVVHDGLVFAGFSGDAGPGEHERGGFVLVDIETQEVLRKTFVIPDEEFNNPDTPYAGAGIWSTPAIDTETGFAYVGTSNPHNPQFEHERANSILKIDLKRDSGTFGEIVDHYKGLPDTYFEGLADQPVCDTYPGAYYVDRFSASCLQIDLDFGASPTLYELNDQKLVGNLQKAGVFHAVDRSSMDGVWQTVVGVPCLACNAASPASVDGEIFTAAGPPGQLFRLGGGDGSYEWAGHLTGITTYNPVTVANGVVYVVDGFGFLNAFDQQTGVQVLKHNIGIDMGRSMGSGSSSSGIAVARNTLYVAVTDSVVAYRLGGGAGDPTLPGLPSPPDAPGGSGGGQVVAGPGAVNTTYATPAVLVPQGTSVTFTNLDLAQHDVISDDGLFSTPLIGLGESAEVAGASELEPGQYGFYCSLHSNMTGTLIVQ